MEFIHTHLHSAFSWDCASKIEKIVKHLKENKSTACAITDHGNMSGVIKFQKQCKDAGIKPILGCLLPTQEIFTTNGIKLIKDIKSGDTVYSHTGKKCKVIQTMNRDHNDYIYTIELANSKTRSLKITGEHPVLIADNNGNKSWVKVEDIDLTKKYKNSGISNYTSYVCCPKIYGSTTKILTKKLLPSNFDIKNNIIKKTKKINKYDSLIKEWSNFSDYLELDKKFCYFWGLFISEGSISIKKNKPNGQCCLTFNITEKHYVNFCKKFLKDRFNIDAKIYEKPSPKNSIDLIWCNIPFANIFKTLTNCPAKNKKIHEIAFDMPLNLQEFLLEGILDGDCKHLTENNLTKTQSLKTCSQNFAWGFRQLLINFGTFARVCEGYDGLNKYKYYSVSYSKYTRYKRSFDDDKFVYYPIKSISKKVQKTKVYNFHVEKDNSYLSDYALHNCEAYICPNQMSATEKSPTNRRLNHVVLLAKNKIGYSNLLKLVYLSNKPENYYYKPRIDEETLFNNAEGLIVLNGHFDTSIFDCLIYNMDALKKCETVEEGRDYLFPNYKEKVLEVANRYRAVFGNDFYIECQLFDKNDIIQQVTGMALFEFAQEYGFKAVGTGDPHYIAPSDSAAHKTFVAIKTNSKVKDLADIGYFNSGKYCIFNTDEAKLCYPEQLILATQEIAAKVENYEITGPQRIPSFTPAKEESLKMVRECVYNRLAEIGRGDNQEYLERVKYELEMTEKGDLQDYFLIVKDYLDWARSKGILTGCGRGCLANTNIILKNGKIKDISEIKIGDKVICKSGNINKVINTFEYNVNEELINIVTNFGESKGITLTKDHKVLACQRSVKYMCGKKKYYDTEFNTTPEWIPASELKIGDFLVQPKINLKEIIPTFDLANFSISIKNGSKVTFDDNFVYSRLNGNKFRKSQVLKSKRYLNITEEFCYVLGIFIGDGWLSKNKTMISFCFNSKTNMDSQKRVINFMESIGCRSHIDLNQNGKKVNQVHFANLAIYQLFRKIFSSYDYTPKSKCIPRFIFNLPDLHKTCLLNGIIDSDGSNDGSKISICTTSKKLANHIKYLTQSLNIPCGMSSELRIEKRKEFGVKSRAYYCRLPIFNNKLIKEYAYRSFKNHNLVKIRKINKVNDIKKVYDFHVENENDYLTTSGIVHNSVGGALIAYLLGITTIDSIKYNLMWDRFMGPDRIENKVLADIDSDFQTSRTQDVIDYITQKYGADKVCGVVTFGLLQGKSAIKAVLSAWGVLDHKQQKDISDRIQSKDKISDKLADFKEETGSDSIILYTLTHDPEALASYVNLVDGKIEGELAPFFELAIELEGSIKTESRHASALIISDRPVYEVAPMIKSKTEDCLLCALDMYSFEQAGLVKFDILSLKNLDGLAQVNSLLKNYDLKKLEKL